MAEAKIKVTADTKSAERNLERLEAALKGIQGVSRAAGLALGGIGVAAIGVAAAFKSLVDRTGDLADLAKALGTNAQALKALQQSAQLAGISSQELTATMFRLRGTLGEAVVKGVGPASDAVKRLGLDLNVVANSPADQQIKMITDELRKIESPAERGALAIQLLGKQGPRMLEVAENAARLEKQMDKLGIRLSDLDVKNLERAGDAMDELGFIAGDALDKALASLAPYVVVLLERLKEAVIEAGGFDNVLRKVVSTIKIAAQASSLFASTWLAGVLITKITAITVAIINIINGIKAATGAMAIFNAVAGKNPLIKIASALLTLGLGVAAVASVNELFADLDKQVDELNKKTQDGIDQAAAGEGRVTAAVNTQNEARRKALESVTKNLTALEESVKIEKLRATSGEATANATKMILEVERQLGEQKLKLQPTDRQRIINAYAQLEAIKQEASLSKVLEGLGTERLQLGYKHARTGEFFVELRKLELEFGRELTGVEYERLEQAIQQTQAARDHTALSKALTDLANEQLNLADADKNTREITVALRRHELTIGRELSNVEKESLTNAIKKTQLAREEAAIAEAIYNSKREQTELEKINRGLNLQSSLNPQGQATTDYKKDQDALKTMLNNKLLTEQQYTSQREALATAHNQKMQDLELKRIETVLGAERNAMAVKMSQQDAAVLRQQGDNERQMAQVKTRIEFEKQSELEKVSFALEQGAQLFGALGQQNKKAFEIAKAFNIANAIMNTYMGATKALATYPPPFNFIAAAAVVGLGLAQVAQIRSQQYSGRALGGPVMGGTPYIVGESGPELFTPSTTGSITRNGDLQGGAPVNVEFTIVANDTQGFDALLSSRKGVIQQIITDAMLERGQRSSM